jgi:hypothetical protein
MLHLAILLIMVVQDRQLLLTLRPGNPESMAATCSTPRLPYTGDFSYLRLVTRQSCAEQDAREALL